MCLQPCFASLCVAGIFLAGTAFGEDRIFSQGSSTPTVGTITEVDDTTVKVTLGAAGNTSLPRAKIERVEIAPPPGAEAGVKAFLRGDHKQAIKLLEPVFTKYRCLPQEWIEEISVQLGEAYNREGEWNKARELFLVFSRFYPKSRFGDVARSGEAQALMKTGKKDAARKILESLIKDLDGKTALSDDQNRALGRALVSFGQCCAEVNQNDQALDAFLKTITIYHLDPNAVAEALYESALVFEKMKNFPRAKGQFTDLLKDFPQGYPFLDEARKKLETLKALTPKEGEP